MGAEGGGEMNYTSSRLFLTTAFAFHSYNTFDAFFFYIMYDFDAFHPTKFRKPRTDSGYFKSEALETLSTWKCGGVLQ
jgi:hypothetical protein